MAIIEGIPYFQTNPFVKHVLWVFQIHQEWSISPYSGIFFGNCVPNVVPPIFPDALASTGMTLHDR